MSSPVFIKRKDIDESKWNACVESSAQSLPYAFSWYLDAVAENWDALVWRDYEFIMPLVWLRKLGVACLYQPYYCQQLGVYGNNPTETIISQFLQAAIKQYSYVHNNLNPSAEKVKDKFRLLPKKNLLLDLRKEYQLLAKKYSENHRRNISRSIKAGLVFGETDIHSFQQFYLQNINRAKENFKPQHEIIFKQLTKSVLEKKAGKFFCITNKTGKLLAACLLLSHQNRIINIINTSSAEGKKSGASHFLFDQIIHLHASQILVLDFEGSSIEGVARFYEGFGASPEIFYNLQSNLIKNFRAWLKA